MTCSLFHVLLFQNSKECTEFNGTNVPCQGIALLNKRENDWLYLNSHNIFAFVPVHKLRLENGF